MSFTDGTFLHVLSGLHQHRDKAAGHIEDTNVLAATRVWQGPDENAQLVTTDADWKM